MGKKRAVKVALEDAEGAEDEDEPEEIREYELGLTDEGLLLLLFTTLTREISLLMDEDMRNQLIDDLLDPGRWAEEDYE